MNVCSETRQLTGDMHDVVIDMNFARKVHARLSHNGERLADGPHRQRAHGWAGGPGADAPVAVERDVPRETSRGAQGLACKHYHVLTCCVGQRSKQQGGRVQGERRRAAAVGGELR